MSSYDPINEYVFAAALSGCVAGAIGAQPVTSSSENVYAETSLTAFAFAQEFDTLWSTASLDVIQQAAILDMCTAYWYGRIPQTTTPAEYEDLCEALIAAVNEVDATAIAGGATPPTYPPTGTSVIGSLGYVVFRPGGVASSTVAVTPAQVTSAQANGAITLYVDSSLGAATLPAGYSLPPFPGGIIGFNGYNGGGFSAPDTLTVSDTANITGLSYAVCVKIVFHCVSEPGIVDTRTQVLLRLDTAFIGLLAGAAVPIYSVPTGHIYEIFALPDSTVNSAAAGVAAFFGNTGTLIGFAGTDSTFGATSLGNAAGSTVLFLNDSSSSPPTFTLIAGSITLIALDAAVNMAYTATTVANWSGTNPTSVGNALDRIAAHITPIP
jgi:hypothetical protein